jgi:hypothetical protein
MAEGHAVELDVVTPQPIKGPRAANIRAERDDATPPAEPATNEA